MLLVWWMDGWVGWIGWRGEDQLKGHQLETIKKKIANIVRIIESALETTDLITCRQSYSD